MDNQSNVSLGCHNKILKFVSETMVGVFGRFSFATATENGSNNENTVKKTLLFGCWFGKKWCLEKRIAKEIENYKPTQLNTLLKRSNAKLKTSMVKPQKQQFHFIQSDSDID